LFSKVIETHINHLGDDKREVVTTIASTLALLFELFKDTLEPFLPQILGELVNNLCRKKRLTASY
jgi:hypothetical protein